MKNLSPYQQFLAEREEILRYKWVESERRGFDIGFEEALLNWATTERAAWKKRVTQESQPTITS